jgi:hypothetical protein
MLRFGFGVSFFWALAGLTLSSGEARAQGQALPPIKVNLPPSPNFDRATAPEQHPTGELSVYGLRKTMSKYLDKDVRVKGYLLQLYECPAEIRKCNEIQAATTKRAKKAGKSAPEPASEAPEGGCRPCDQPHFFIGDTPTTKLERSLLVADYPIKDWETGKPKPLVVEPGAEYVVTGTFSINSMTGFAASNGLIIHKRLEDAAGKMIAEGNAVLPPEAQTIQLEGKPAQPLPAKRAN